VRLIREARHSEHAIKSPFVIDAMSPGQQQLRIVPMTGDLGTTCRKGNPGYSSGIEANEVRKLILG